jgi:hypothetical protein
MKPSPVKTTADPADVGLLAGPTRSAATCGVTVSATVATTRE